MTNAQFFVAVAIPLFGITLAVVLNVWLNHRAYESFQARLDRSEDRLGVRLDRLDGRIDGLHDRLDGINEKSQRIEVALSDFRTELHEKFQPKTHA